MKRITKHLFSNTSSLWGTFFCLFFSVFVPAQIYVSDDAQLFVGKDVILTGEIELIQKQNSKAEIYISAGSTITGTDQLSNVEIVKIDNISHVEDVSHQKLSNKIKNDLESKEEDKVLPENPQEIQNVNFQIPHSDEVIYANHGVSKSCVTPTTQDIIWLNIDQVGISIFPLENCIFFIAPIKAVMSANIEHVRIRPPPIFLKNKETVSKV